ncbi:MAG TPA: hypothetical protein VFX92_00080 [Candidatus Krumholzibacteria bacterium]|nr:hypothetical protein [Candidatus Krumholzibacteria bacterium]
MRTPRPEQKSPSSPAAHRGPISPRFLDAAVVLLTLACFWPLVHFYFAQDDFVFLERASHGFGEAMGGFFGAHPGQFRPLTKGLYFVLTWPLFGLHALPFHVVSILLHAGNAILVGVLLRRMGISSAVSRLVAALFALNVGYLEAVAWVSCVQQLIGTGFMLLALIFGIDALEGRRTRSRAMSSIALLLALASYEQTLATPVVLAGWYAMRHGVRASIDAMRRRLWEQPAILLLYLLFTLGVRGVPDSGPYVMSVGPHVLDNLRTYAGLVYALWLMYPAYGLPAGFTPSHALLIGVAGYLLVRRRVAEVAFGLGTFLVLIAPVLFVRDHTHSFHVYVAAIGIWFLAAVALDDALARVRVNRTLVVRGVLVAAALACFAGSLMAVRKNSVATVGDALDLPRSFVLRRAVLAERIRDDLLPRSRLHGKSGRLFMLYLYPQYRANWLNIHSALGQGSAVRLMLESPHLDVLFVPPLDIAVPDDPSVEVFVYTELGRCYTAHEVEEAQRRRAESGATEHAPGAPPDSTLQSIPSTE